MRSIHSRSLWFGALVGLAFSANAQAQAVSCPSPKVVQGFKTCADLDAVAKEGSVVVYSTDVEAGTAMLLEDFHKLFPNVNATYVRAAPGGLYARILAEKQANAGQADVLMLSDIGLALDFQKRQGWLQYESPELSVYKPEFRSNPSGYYAWGSVIMSGISYNPNVTPPDQAPKNWMDLQDPKWVGGINFKGSTSGLQHLTWYELRRVYGPTYWQYFEKTKALSFDSMVQQYERIVNGKDKINAAAQYSGYLALKAKGAPLNFVFPPDGSPAGPQVWGVVKGSPHPASALLFMDWYLSKLGQTSMVHALSLHSVHPDAPPPEGGIPLSQIKLLYPADWTEFLASKNDFNKQWKIISSQ